MNRGSQYKAVLDLMRKYKITLECLNNYTVMINGKRYYILKEMRSGYKKKKQEDK